MWVEHPVVTHERLLAKGDGMPAAIHPANEGSRPIEFCPRGMISKV